MYNLLCHTVRFPSGAQCRSPAPVICFGKAYLHPCHPAVHNVVAFSRFRIWADEHAQLAPKAYCGCGSAAEDAVEKEEHLEELEQSHSDGSEELQGVAGQQAQLDQVASRRRSLLAVEGAAGDSAATQKKVGTGWAVFFMACPHLA